MSSAAVDRLQSLIAEARSAAAQGQSLRAAQAWERLLAEAPDQPDALVGLSQLRLGAGDLAGAEALLIRALAAHPRLSLAHAYMARIHLQRGHGNAALTALDAAIHHDPGAWGARFEKARLLESLGRTREAALCWGQALQALPPHAAQQPHLQPILQHAEAAVRADQAELRAFLESRMGDLRAGERPRDLERFEHALDIVSGRRAFVTAKPNLLPIPRLPAIPFFNREDFDWAPAVEAATPAVLAELQALLSDAQDPGFTPYVQTRAGESAGQFAALDRNSDWSAYFLYRHGERVEAHCQRCPDTLAAVSLAPLPRIRARAPAVMFSRLAPHTHIPPHNGATNARLTVHLPLIIPERCRFRVGDESREWRMGELFLFDDTIRHEAWNDSDHTRVVLIFDIWHPMLTELERALVTRTVEGLVEFYDASSDLGEL